MDEDTKKGLEALLRIRGDGPSLVEQVMACEHARGEPFRDGDYAVTVCTKCYLVLEAEEIRP